MSFSYCNDSVNKIIREIDYFRSRLQHARNIYDKCIDQRVGNCHLILDDIKVSNNSINMFEQEKEKYILRCKIETEVNN